MSGKDVGRLPWKLPQYPNFQSISKHGRSLHQRGDRIQVGDKTLIVTDVRTIEVVDRQRCFIQIRDPAYGGYADEDE